MSDFSVFREMNKKGFVDPIRTLTLAQLKQEQTDRSRTPTGKEVHLHRLYLDPHSKARLANAQVCRSTLKTHSSLVSCRSYNNCPMLKEKCSQILLLALLLSVLITWVILALIIKLHLHCMDEPAWGPGVKIITFLSVLCEQDSSPLE